jgi:hypothetical protein
MSGHKEIGGSKISLQILTEGFENPDGPRACTSRCCLHGVYLDPTERDQILSCADVVEKYLDETQTKDRMKWFDNSEEEDSDFPSGKCVSTEVYNEKCVFLNQKGQCVLQVAEIEEKMPTLSLKPYYCILFPIVKVNGVYQYDDLCFGESACCTASRMRDEKMVEVCSNELRHALGASKYDEVLGYYRNGIVGGKNQRVEGNVQSEMSFVRKDEINARE